MDGKPEKPWWQPGLTVFAEVTGWIAAPILVALFLGRYLDEKNNSEPWFYLGLTGIAFVISSIGIATVAIKYIRQIEREGKQQIKKNDSNAQHDSHRNS
ncbi:MAG: AtpZ/AtpI family protein [Patescibacteria group bacterium]|nr:AtpZ/AtpI family protein [Patescibacteria group bacterium]MDD5716125.1 AtpZ/AtpI family protein [Patescibacteria group bacterium]